MTLTDQFGVSWSEKWKAVPNSYSNTTYYQLDNGDYKKSTNHSLAYADAYVAGFSTDIMSTCGLNYVVGNSGDAEIQIEARNPKKSGTDQLCVNYTHKKGIAGSLSYALRPVSISYTGSAGAHTQGIYYDFEY